MALYRAKIIGQGNAALLSFMQVGKPALRPRAPGRGGADGAVRIQDLARVAPDPAHLFQCFILIHPPGGEDLLRRLEGCDRGGEPTLLFQVVHQPLNPGAVTVHHVEQQPLEVR